MVGGERGKGGEEGGTGGREGKEVVSYSPLCEILNTPLSVYSVILIVKLHNYTKYCLLQQDYKSCKVD